MDNVVQLEREVLEQSTQLEDCVNEYFVWEEQCNACLKLLRENCQTKRPKLATGIQQSLIARIARLEGLKQSLRRRFIHDEADHSNVGFFWCPIDTAFDKRILTAAVINLNYIEPRKFLDDAKTLVLEHVQNALMKHGSLKVNAFFNGEFVAGDKRANKFVSTNNFELFQASDLQEWYGCITESILSTLGEFQERDSGWALLRILNLTINVNMYNPMRAGCHFNLPREIYLKKAVINVKSMDNACFAWAVVAAIRPAKRHVDLQSSYPHYRSVLNLQNIHFPMSLKQIPSFERLNDISINVYGVRDMGRCTIAPIHLTKMKRDQHVNLLYVEDSQNSGIGHFAWVKNLSRLVSSQLSKHHGRKYVCDRCLQYFHSSERLDAHAIHCNKINSCAIILPSDDDKWLAFKNYKMKLQIPFIVYADLECILERASNEAAPKFHQHHKVFSIAYYTHCSHDTSLSRFQCYRGADCIPWFVKQLEKLAFLVQSHLTNIVPLENLSNEQCEAFQNAIHCHICEEPFTLEDGPVHDHCHLTGRYRGAAHSNCNLNYKVPHFIPIVFHNLSGYDSHFIIKEIATMFEGGVNLLPITKEKYISFTKDVASTATTPELHNCIKLRFIDSYKFLNASLDKLVTLLNPEELQILRSQFRVTDNDFNLLTRKGIFPYEYLDCPEKLQDTSLPPREAFHSSLTGEGISDSDYEHAINVWQRFSIQTLGEYSDLYLKTDVLLLAEVFENFRHICVESYGLDPTHHYTLPGFTWDAMLKYTKVNFELLTDIDMVLFIERGIRGGLSQCSNRYAKANNKYMQTYDSSHPTSYLMYFDVNNLYGWAMCQSLPHGEFKWVQNVENFNISEIDANSPTGYILEVDFEYPQHLHDMHADLPFCPTRARPPGEREKRLLATLYDKHGYIIHYRNLQQCIRHGLQVTKIHRILQFAQSTWLQRYIELNTHFRTCATTNFEKNLYKLMNNAVFGKTMENVRNYVDVKLVSTWDGRYGAEALIAKPNFHSRSIFSENLIAVELRKLEVKFNKPIYVGMCILDLSKICIYEFHHEYMYPMYRENCKIMYTDTDSLIYHIQCEDVYETMKRDIARFDTSDYPVNNIYGIPLANKKIPGLMKDENNGAIMSEFIGLRSKMYALRVDGKNDVKKVKGVNSKVVAKSITFDDYVQCLENEIEMSRTQTCIRSKLHEVYTVNERKIALSPHDDKRYIISNSIKTLPWGHHDIPP